MCFPSLQTFNFRTKAQISGLNGKNLKASNRSIKELWLGHRHEKGLELTGNKQATVQCHYDQIWKAPWFLMMTFLYFEEIFENDTYGNQYIKKTKWLTWYLLSAVINLFSHLHNFWVTEDSYCWIISKSVNYHLSHICWGKKKVG